MEDPAEERPREVSMCDHAETAADSWRQLWLKKSKRQVKRPEKVHDTTRQLNLEGHNLDLNDEDKWGDDYEIFGRESIRIGFQNVQGLPTFANGVKNSQIADSMETFGLDILGIAETNLCWKNLDRYDNWYERVRNLQGIKKSVFTYNKKDVTEEKVQYGGTAILVRGDWVHRIIETGEDDTKLGRWVWIKFRGKNGHEFRVISVYKPCDSIGELTVAEQHRREYAKTDKHDDQEKTFLDDLKNTLQPWITKGESIIVLADANEDVRKGNFNKTLNDLGAIETITNLHGTRGPATQQRNNTRTPIDGIWASSNNRADRAGYLEFGAGISSDHRMIWAEFDKRDLLGMSIPGIVKVKARRLKIGDTKLVDEYNEKVNEIFTEKGLFQTLEQLRNTEVWEHAHTKTFNHIVRLNNKIRHQVEDSLRKLRMGQVEWFPELQSKRNEIRLWLCVLKKKSGGKVCHKVIKRSEKKTMIYETSKLSKTQVIENLKQAFKEYKALKKEAPNKREEFLRIVARGRAERNNTTEESEYKQMIAIERQRKLAYKIKRHRTSKQRTATIKVFYTDELGERQECLTKEEIEEACINENKERFTQSHNTPFMVPPLSDLVGYLADEEAANQILSGDFVIPSCIDKYTKLLIEELAQPEGIVELSTKISDEENRTAWTKQKETISSVGLHFGHLKAATFDDQLNHFDAGIREIPYSRDISPLEWQKIVDVEILKKAGVFDIEKMRTIQLMDSYFNMNNKKLGKEVIHNAETRNLIAKEQFGSRKGHRSILAALNKRLTMDILRQKRKTGAIVVNDAKSCYDRILYAITVLAMRRLGAPRNAVTIMCKTLQKAAHKVRTAFGESDTSYHSDELIKPLHGLGQGNGCAPTGWACISTPIINMMRKAAFGVMFLAAISLTILRFVCYAFVDDTDLIHAAEDNSYKGEDIIPEIQDAIDHWEGGLRATGGAIMTERNKTYWCLFEFKWTKNGWKFVSEDEVPGDITVREATGTRKVKIDRKSNTTGHQTLGVYISGDGSEKEQTEYLKKATIDFADWIRKSNLQPHEVNHAVQTTIMKTLEYPMEAICMNIKQWKSVMSHVRQAALPIMGVCRNYPHDALYGPYDHQGLGWKDPYLWQYLTHIKVILKEEYSQSITGELLKTTMEQSKLELGMPGMLTEIPKEAWEWTEKRTWIRETIMFMKDIEMHMEDDINLTTSRVNDQFIMESFIKSNYSKQQLFILNCCRMNCQAVTLADIITGDGKFIRKSCFIAQPDTTQNQRYDWPRKIPLDNNWVKFWQDSLIETFRLQSNNGKWKLLVPLGEWLDNSLHWNLWSDNEFLFKRNLNQWDKYTRTSRTRNNLKYRKVGTVDRLPHNIQRATGEHSNDVILFTGSASHRTHTEPTYNDIYEARRNLNKEEKWAIGQWVWPVEWRNIISAIEGHRAIAVSDGSFKDEYGTSAFTIGDFTTNMIGVNVTPGEADDQQSNRSELAGVIGILTTLKLLCQTCSIRQGTVTIGLDGLNVIKHLAKGEPPDPFDADFDMYTCVHQLLQEVPLGIEWRWVEGHQDEDNDWSDLDDWAKHNIYMDNTAKQYWEFAKRTNIRAYKQRLWGEKKAIFWNFRKLTRFRTKEIYDEQANDIIGDYWMEKEQLKATNIHNIDWEVLKKVNLKMPFQRRIWLSQQLTGMAGVNHWLHRWNKTEHHECPLCEQPHETTEHVMLCNDQRAVDQWNDSLQHFREKLEELHTPIPIITEIISGLRSWRNNTQHQGTDCQSAVRDQNDIGWRNFLYGRISRKWRDQYTELADANISQGKRWATEMVSKLMKVSWDQWQFRNAIKHSADHPLVAEERERVGQLVNSQFLQGTHHLLPKDRRRLNISKEEILKKSLEAQKKWVESMEAARTRYIEHNRGDGNPLMQGMRNLLSSWLHNRSENNGD